MKKVIIGIVIVLVLVGGAFALTKTGDDKSEKSASNSGSTSAKSDNSSSQSDRTASNTNSVSINNFKFSPADITVKKGTTVTWTNNDSVGHTVTETDGKDGPKSSDLNQGQTYSFTYNTVGTFKYICSIHPNMTGSVTVTE